MKKIKNLFHFFYAWLGAIWYGYPSEELLVIGVTGTSGKSSVIYFLKQVLESIGFKVGALSTIEFCVAGKCQLNDKKMTMLGRMFIQKKLREMANAGCQIAIIETTSEGYLQHRHRFINYDTIVLTNLYPEHLEAHGGFENYKNAKLGIFKYVSQCNRKREIKKLRNWETVKTAIVNGGSEYAEEFLKFGFDKKIVFGKIPPYFAPIYGEYNAENLSAVIAVAKSLDIAEEKIKQAIAKIKSPPGRIEFIPEAEKLGFKVIVDYAFEPVALGELYKVVELIKPDHIIHVCGSTGGGRDKSRRPEIGKLAGEKADVVIVTNEDPYDENPMEIIKAVSAGVKKAGKEPVEILDRGEAIKKAIDLAQAGDLVLITGKGSEQAIAVAGGKLIKWDDREEVRKCLISNF